MQSGRNLANIGAEISVRPVSELLQYAGNAKLHPAEQVDQIAESLNEFGFNNPVLVWHNKDGEPEIVAGHGRVMAARKLGIEELPVISLDHLSDEQRRAYALVDNQLTMNSGFDVSMMLDELESISGIDMSKYSEDWTEEALRKQLPEADIEGSQFAYSEQYAVIVICDSASEQEATLQELKDRGYNCEKVTV